MIDKTVNVKGGIEKGAELNDNASNTEPAVDIADVPDPFRTHLDTKANDQRRALEGKLKDRERPEIDPADIGAPHLREEES
jgi:hypothetical protein